MKTNEVNATKGGAVANKKIELEIVKVIENPMAELESLDEREKGIVDVVKKSVKNLLDISQMMCWITYAINRCIKQTSRLLTLC